MQRLERLGTLLVGSHFQYMGNNYKILARTGNLVHCLRLGNMRRAELGSNTVVTPL